ncbi:hypothetical protein CVS28_17295 [Arthrobacter glacialis]|nr:hypothetical protein CVS28_17295 [Arthrobacter glacialis]
MKLGISDDEHVKTKIDEVTRILNKPHPQVAAMLGDAREAGDRRSPGRNPRELLGDPRNQLVRQPRL